MHLDKGLAAPCTVLVWWEGAWLNDITGSGIQKTKPNPSSCSSPPLMTSQAKVKKKTFVLPTLPFFLPGICLINVLIIHRYFLITCIWLSYEVPSYQSNNPHCLAFLFFPHKQSVHAGGYPLLAGREVRIQT